ncbi:50S ribosomal protein L32 [Mycoplasma suis]|uniref:Large ribosomal subunit protein bL32 n=2 Tax=Mycoplasma suis TaxID=57372 RepID=F0QQT5_MYCSL|nr:50S ribosomal protein L32 [Mycoplasma suis]ADX97855.1 50S ribosomal protein L32 [Mycoplasma suis str. Illinois]CCF55052.1 50S ribosomal protein L32 [Mycoplasma suis KI3806]
MAVSPRRVSKTKKRMRNSHSGIKSFHPLQQCPKCAKITKLHMVCACGYYRNKRIIQQPEKKE